VIWIGYLQWMQRATKRRLNTSMSMSNQNARSTIARIWLQLAHRRLDEAVFAAYGWAPSLSDDDLLAALLALNLQRAEASTPV
jgi:hypothetical protein